jgi:hypothetical protein
LITKKQSREGEGKCTYCKQNTKKEDQIFPSIVPRKKRHGLACSFCPMPSFDRAQSTRKNVPIAIVLLPSENGPTLPSLFKLQSVPCIVHIHHPRPMLIMGTIRECLSNITIDDGKSLADGLGFLARALALLQRPTGGAVDIGRGGARGLVGGASIVKGSFACSGKSTSQ